LTNDLEADFAQVSNALEGVRETKWINLGGQLVPEKEIDLLRADIGSGKLQKWDEIHHKYDSLWSEYPLAKQKHAYAVFCKILETDRPTKKQWLASLDKVVMIQDYIRDQVYISRKKDFDNPFRQATYRNMSEMTASIGTVEENSFVKQVRKETENFKKLVAEIKERS
jgi:hypothetical protein